MPAADAILTVNSEYHYSVPGVLTHAADGALRLYGDSGWNAKPVGIMVASVWRHGTAMTIVSTSDVRLFEHVSAGPAGGHDCQCRR